MKNRKKMQSIICAVLVGAIVLGLISSALIVLLT